MTPESVWDGANDEWAGIARVGEAAWAMADVGSMSAPTKPAMARQDVGFIVLLCS
ncbi:hypothetical protein [Kibdelosporangium aridum]|uniref:hypothetical protein n=1 Tax=Kibdelosporangium aridum TaxID=2030 RepID=UPI000A4803EE|nr:hypothetical protein [Kibdelosporangium aridum]